MPAPAELSDTTIVDYLRHHPSASVVDLVAFTGVTATAVRQRLLRLLEQGWVQRESVRPGTDGNRSEATGRGRPEHRYWLTPEGIRSSGTNFEDLAVVLWDELATIKDPALRRGLLRRLVGRLMDNYRDQVGGDTLRERMNGLVALMAKRAVPFIVEEVAGARNEPEGLPVLTALACPYPDLAEQDRMICVLEKLLFSEMLGERVHLTACRLDGASCCTFATGSAC